MLSSYSNFCISRYYGHWAPGIRNPSMNRQGRILHLDNEIVFLSRNSIYLRNGSLCSTNFQSMKPPILVTTFWLGQH